jgi:hypothetical protein
MQVAGCPPVLSEDKEKLIEERLLMQRLQGFLLTTLDLHNTIRDYLDSQGRTTRFIDNMPRPDFVQGFLRQSSVISVWKANLIKQSHAAVAPFVMKAFFSKLASLLQAFLLATCLL